MKKISVISAAILILAAYMVSCSVHEDPVVPVSGNGAFFASIESPLTKISVTDKGVVQWNQDDRISVNGGVYKIHLMTSPTTAYFEHVSGHEAEKGEPIHAFFPCTIQSGENMGILPSVWAYDTKNVTNLPMYAFSDDSVLTFKNICGALKISVGKNRTVRRINVSSGQPLSGTFKVENGDSLVLTNVSASDSVVLDCGNGVSGTDFYVPIPAGRYGYLRVTLKTADSTYVMVTSAEQEYIEIEKNTIFPFSFDFDPASADLKAEIDAVYDAFAANLLSPQPGNATGDYSLLFAAFNLCGDDVMVADYDSHSQLYAFNTLTYNADNEVVKTAFNGIVSTLDAANKFIGKWSRMPQTDTVMRCIGEARTLRAYLHVLMAMGWDGAPKLDHVVSGTFADTVTNCDRGDLLRWCRDECCASEGKMATHQESGVLRITREFCKTVWGMACLYRGGAATQEAYQLFDGVCNSGFKLVNKFDELFHYEGNADNEKIFEMECTPSSAQYALFDWRSSAFVLDPSATYTGGAVGKGCIGVRDAFCRRFYRQDDDGASDRYVASVMKISDAVYGTDKGSQMHYSDPAIEGMTVEQKKVSNKIGLTSGGMACQSHFLPFKQVERPGDAGGKYFTIMRLAEVQLMAAEARLFWGDLATTLSIINTIRARSNLKAISGQGETGERIRDTVRAEMDCELFFEGHRWINQVRWADQTTTDALRGNRIITTLYDKLTRAPKSGENPEWENGSEDDSRFYTITKDLGTDGLTTKYYHFPYPSDFLKKCPNVAQSAGW